MIMRTPRFDRDLHRKTKCLRPLKIFAASIYIFGQGSGGDICLVHTLVDRKLCSVKIQKNSRPQVKTSSFSGCLRRRPAMSTAQLTSRSRLRTEQPRSISSLTSELCLDHPAMIFLFLICLDGSLEFSRY